MKLIALSDLHGDLPIIKEVSDIVIIAGDISPINIQKYAEDMQIWFNTLFLNWIKSLKTNKVYLVAGNHDFYLKMCKKEYINSIYPDKLIYLENDKAIYSENGKDWNIFGTPYCHTYGYWPFMLNDDELYEKFEEIPENLDILITHDAPYGCSDVLLDFLRHLGNIPLRHMILNKNPKYVLHGHLHTSSHNEEILGISKVYNVSIKDERYNTVYEPLILNM